MQSRQKKGSQVGLARCCSGKTGTNGLSLTLGLLQACMPPPMPTHELLTQPSHIPWAPTVYRGFLGHRGNSLQGLGTADNP